MIEFLTMPLVFPGVSIAFAFSLLLVFYITLTYLFALQVFAPLWVSCSILFSEAASPGLSALLLNLHFLNLTHVSITHGTSPAG